MEVREPSAKYLGASDSDCLESESTWSSQALCAIAQSVSSGRSRADSEQGVFEVFGSTGVIGRTNWAAYEGPAILVARVGANAGAVNTVDGRYGVTDNTIIVRVTNNISLPFVAYQLKAANLNSMVFGSGQPLITGSQLKALHIDIPQSRLEQDTIVRVLTDADALIDSLEQLLTKKRQIKQGAMEELLTGQRRLPGFDQPWQKSKLRQLGNFLKGSGIRRDEALSGDLPCVRYGEIYTTHSDYIRSFSSWISPVVASTSTVLRPGDLLFAGSGETKEEIGRCVAFLYNVQAYAGGDIVILRPTVEADSMFLGYLFNMPSVVRQKASRGQGDAVVHISAIALGEIEVELPGAAEQAAIAHVLSDMDTELTALESRLTKARALKQAMAQALLTGRIRLVGPCT
jgi:type I restriction enzyme S subunit